MKSSLFHEEQRFRQWWIWAIVLLVAVLAWAAWVQQILRGEEFGTNPGPDWGVWLIWVLFGIGLPVLAWITRLKTEVDETGLTIQFWPFMTRRIPADSVQNFQDRTYDPIRDYGGWGVRGLGKNRAYNASGHEGVELTLDDGRSVLIGSQRSADLAAALASMADSRA